MANEVRFNGGGSKKLSLSAIAKYVLKGLTFSNDGKNVIEGTMPDNGAVSQSLNAGGSYTIPEGYHNGNGKVSANSLASQTDGTATAAGILDGLIAWVKGVKVVGTMPNNGAVSKSLNAGGSYTIPEGYHNGSGKVTANSLASQTDGTATAADILKDKTAVVDGVKITGTMESMAGSTVTPGTSNKTIACSGKKMTSNIVVAGDADLDPSNIRKNASIFGVDGGYVGEFMEVIEIGTVDGKTASYTITVPSDYDMDKVVVCAYSTSGSATSSTSYYNFTYTESGNKITFTHTYGSTSFAKADIQYAVLYAPSAKSVNRYTVISSDAEIKTITTEGDETNSIILTERAISGTGSAVCGNVRTRSGNSTEIIFGYVSKVVITEIVF